MTELEKRQEKAKARRYKKPAVRGLTFDEIVSALWDMQEACNDVIYWMDSDDGSLVDALEGNEDDAERFKMDFAQLSADVDRMISDMSDVWEPDRFDDVLVISGIGRQTGQGLYGFDDFEGDYFGIDPFSYGWAEDESKKRLERLTKNELLEQVAQTLSITYAFMGIRSRYEDLQDSIDILRSKNREYLDAVKTINEIYESIDFNDRYFEWSEEAKKLDDIISRLPQEAFL